MDRRLIVLIAILGFGGCSGTQTLPGSCEGPHLNSDAVSELSNLSACSGQTGQFQRVAAVGSVRQTGSQARTVGVAREFLVAMIVIIVLVALL